MGITNHTLTTLTLSLLRLSEVRLTNVILSPVYEHYEQRSSTFRPLWASLEYSYYRTPD